MKREGFPRQIRIKKESEFNSIIQGARKTSGRHLILYRLVGDSRSGQKLGIRAARGIKPAVRRNAVKRIVREVLRKNRHRFDENEAVVVVCKHTAGAQEPSQLREELERLISRTGQEDAGL
jgi:ribonuclease P protein component